MSEFRTGRHVVHTLHAHLVLTTKYRRGAITTDRVRDCLETAMRSVCADFGADIEAFEADGDHVHLLLSWPPQVALSRLVGSLKGVSARRLRQEDFEEVRSRLWGNHFWSPSYCIVSCGGAPLEIVKAYVEAQSDPNRRRTGAQRRAEMKRKKKMTTEKRRLDPSLNEGGCGGFCSFAQETGYLRLNVGKVVKAPPVKNALAERILSEADAMRMLALETNARNRALLTLLYGAGLRISEACSLRWRDLAERGDAGQATVFGKGGKTRVVLLSANTWRQVQGLGSEEALDPDAPVFLSRKGGALDPSQVHRIVKAAAARAGISAEVSAHWLRHAHASHSLERGAPIHLVQATLGHASVATTGRCLHARPTGSSARYLGV